MKRYIQANIYIRMRSVGSLKRFFISEDIRDCVQMGNSYLIRIIRRDMKFYAMMNVPIYMQWLYEVIHWAS